MAWSKHYRAFGFEFASEIELPGVPEASPRGTPEVIIRLWTKPLEEPLGVSGLERPNQEHRI